MSEVFLYGTGGGGKGEDLEEVLTEQEELIENLKEALENKIAVSNTDIVPLTVTENGTYTAPEGQAYSPVEVNVAGGGSSSDLVGVLEGTLTSLNNSDITTLRDYALYLNKSLEEVTLPNVVTVGSDVFGYSNLKKISMSKVRDVGSEAFKECDALVDVDMPSLETLTTYVFDNCSALQTISLPSATSIGSYCFQSCTALESVDLPKITSVGIYAFTLCSALKAVNMPIIKSLGRSSLANCIMIERFDLPSVTSINQYAFSGCYSLKTVILRSPSMCTLANTNAFNACYHFHGTVNSIYNPNGDKDGYIYVPSALIDGYKAATNWSTLATQFRAIEDYPEICGEV